MLKEFEVPEGYEGFLYLVKNENVPIAIECFASKVPIEYVTGEDGKPTEEETNTAGDRARIAITAQHDRQINRYAQRKVADAVEPITNIVS